MWAGLHVEQRCRRTGAGGVFGFFKMAEWASRLSVSKMDMGASLPGMWITCGSQSWELDLGPPQNPLFSFGICCSALPKLFCFF